MARIIVLDAGPLGLASKPRGKPGVDRCNGWINAIEAAGARIVAPEIADYEVRRELLRVNAKAGIRRLDQFVSVLDYEPIMTLAMRRAAEFWATVRQAGTPTADPHALDADCILAAQISLLGGPDDIVTIATTNRRHLGRFPGIDAQEWGTITA
jgi:hypothetical protein